MVFLSMPSWRQLLRQHALHPPPPSFGLLFPGQGTLYPGMMKNLCRFFPHLTTPILEEASQMMQQPLLTLLHATEDITLLQPTQIAQPIIFLNSVLHYICFKV
jgi:malonyl CoA-acyl carrier protein transacylase